MELIYEIYCVYIEGEYQASSIDVEYHEGKL